MKYLFATTLLAVSACFTGCQSTDDKAPQVLPLTVKHHQSSTSKGQLFYSDDYYRGSQRILQIARFQNESTKTWETWRFYYVDGKAVLWEDDPGNGKPVTVYVIKEIGWLYETYDAFSRQPDGSVTPLSSEELAKFKAKERDFLGSDYKEVK